jgi:hypothetical protein
MDKDMKVDVEQYRSITKNFNGSLSDKQFIIGFFLKHYQSLSCSLCAIGFDNLGVIDLILSNDECVDILNANDAIRALYCIDSKHGRKCDIIINHISRSRKLFDKNTDIITYVFRRDYDEYFLKLLGSGYLQINDIVNNLSVWHLLSSSCFDTFIKYFGSKIDSTTQKRLIIDLLQSDEYLASVRNDDHDDRPDFLKNLPKLLDVFKHVEGIDADLIYLTFCSSYSNDVKIMLIEYFMSKISLDTSESEIVMKYLNKFS